MPHRRRAGPSDADAHRNLRGVVRHPAEPQNLHRAYRFELRIGRAASHKRLSHGGTLQQRNARAQGEAKNNYERAVPLVGIDAISQSQFDQYTAEYMAAEAAVNSAEQALSNAELELGYADIYAAIDGIISSTEAHIGEFVGPGTQFSTLTTIQNVDTVGVNLSIPMQQYLEYSGRKTFTYDNRGLLSDIVLTPRRIFRIQWAQL